MSRPSNLLVLGCLLCALISCSRSANSPGRQTPIKQGGVDGGGGNVIKSDQQQIRAIFHGDNGFDSLSALCRRAFFQFPA